jgi:hypothetical protein
MSLQISPDAKSLKPGLYKHFKGNMYRVLGIALHSETLEECVIYQAQYGEKLTFIRPLTMFLEQVEVNGKKIPRFQFIEP